VTSFVMIRSMTTNDFETWFSQRQTLHQAVNAATRISSPSQTAYLRGPKTSWTELEFASLWERAPSKGTSNNLYVHVPFCKSICSFCNYDRLKPGSPEALKEWKHRLLASIETLAPHTKHLRFQSLYFGGGTPSVLPAKILKPVLVALDRSFHFRPGASRNIELDPANVNPGKVATLLEHGFKHYSFGVQTLKPERNAAHNRGSQDEDLVMRTLDILPGPLVGTVALDILIGLAGVSPDDTLADLGKLMAHPRQPQIDLFHLTATNSYIQSHFGGSPQAAASWLAQYDETFDQALEALCDLHGYRVRNRESRHARILQPRRFRPSHIGPDLKRLARNTYRALPHLRSGRLFKAFALGQGYTQLTSIARKPLNLLGLGPSARSQIFGLASAQTFPSAGSKGPTHYLGQEMTLQEELRTFLAFEIRDRGSVKDRDFRRLFGMKLAEARPKTLKAWQRLDFARPVRGGWAFTRSSPSETAQMLLWSVPTDNLQHEIEKRRGPRS